jgi:two-component system response regulator TctD
MSRINTVRTSCWRHDYDVVVLDLRLPDKHGLTPAGRDAQGRHTGPGIDRPGSLQDRAKGLNVGADDFQFAIEELRARSTQLGRVP